MTTEQENNLRILANTKESLLHLQLFADAMPHIVWTSNPDGELDYYNKRFYEYTGMTWENAKHWGWQPILHPDDLQPCIDHWTHCVTAGKDYEIEYRLKGGHDGIYRWHLGRALPIRNEEGQIIKWVGTCTNIDAQKQAEKALIERAEREALINQISTAVRSSLEPDEIQRITVSILGPRLNVDVCRFTLCDHSQDLLISSARWQRSPESSLPTSMRFSAVRPILHELYASGTAVISDVEMADVSEVTQKTVRQIGARALISVPILDNGRLIAILTAIMTDTPRVWTSDEILLFETVATLLRTALETARIHQRERHIADSLQGALLPDRSENIPGLDWDIYYQAALDEAKVGGDFADVFAVDPGKYALIVGDLSGKGLAAAGQVARVRNMLRFAIHSHPNLADAVTELNRILVVNNLLVGFATLSVALYEPSQRILTYVSCGQEPCLIRRTASGETELLPPTGPILGGGDASQYEQQTISLLPGDAFAFYTDGLTESGPDRGNLLGVPGLKTLFEEAAQEKTAAGLITHLVNQVKTHAAGKIQDDICLLVSIVLGDESK